jgi:hypothetical protein
MFNAIVPIAGSAGASHARRLGMRRSLILAGMALAFSVTALPASAANWWSTTPSVSIGSTTINVLTAGAKGDGQHDDTRRRSIRCRRPAARSRFLPAPT